MAPNL